MVAAALGGIGHGFVFPILTNEVVRRARVAERGSSLAIFTALFDIGVIAVVPVIGSVIDSVGYPAAFRTTGAVIAVGLVAFVYLERQPETLDAS